MRGWICLLLLAGAASGQIKTSKPPLECAARWVEYYAVIYGVPEELIAAIIDEESGWNAYAVSSRGAAGIMQLMPETAIRFGVRNRFRASENIRGGVAYLAWLLQRFRGDLRLVTASYYVGEGPIAAQGLRFCSHDVHSYVERVAGRYRVRRLMRARRSGWQVQLR
jgi:soluble lytic murein transglycosylase-like protein